MDLRCKDGPFPEPPGGPQGLIMVVAAPAGDVWSTLEWVINRVKARPTTSIRFC